LALVDKTVKGAAECPSKTVCGTNQACAGEETFANTTGLGVDDCIQFCETQNTNGFESYWVQVPSSDGGLCECYGSCDFFKAAPAVNQLILVDNTVDGTASCPTPCRISPFNYVLVGDANVFGGAGTDAESPRTACIDSNTPSGFKQNNVNLLNALANFDDEACLELGDSILVDIRYTAFFDQDGDPFMPTLANEYAAGLKNALSPMTDINPTTFGPFNLTSPGTLDAYKTIIFYSPVGIPQEEQGALLDFMLSGGRVILIVDGFISDASAASLNATITNLWGGSTVFDTSFTTTSDVSLGSTVTNMKLNVTAGDLCYASGRNVVIGSSGVPVAYYSHILQPNPGPPLIVVGSVDP
jgi:hypothetical protein